MKKQPKTSIRVPNVRIGSSVCAVRFKVMAAKQAIKCSTKGQEPLFIHHQHGEFVTGTRQAEGPTARHPAQAFAKAVKEFWNMW